MLEMDLEVDDKQLATLSDRLKELEEMEKEAEDEIQDLELVSWDEKLHMEKQKEQRMRTEIMLLQSSILKSESEISRIEKKIKLLTGEIDSANRASQESKQKEEETMLVRCKFCFRIFVEELVIIVMVLSSKIIFWSKIIITKC